ncbi:MAG: type II toxin-antitoxin system Phd/YefM family antitoxin [Proteobacteria bacterium]|nr:type II toxin-antitoxin system Phd/YefM family antitoxin [Pseudomonadota bacterium]
MKNKILEEALAKKVHFSKLVDAAIRGEETVITRSGEPVAKLVPIKARKLKIKFGVLKGKIKIAEDFDAPLPGNFLSGFRE